MKDFLQALSTFSFGQLLTSLAILLPVIAGIWFALRWAYESRTKNLESSLKEYQSDFERRIARELSKTTDEHERQTQAQLSAHNAELAELRSKLETANTDLSATQSELMKAQEALAFSNGEIHRIQTLQSTLSNHTQFGLAFDRLMADFSGETFAVGNIASHWRSTSSNLQHALSEAVRLDLLRYGSGYYWATESGKTAFKAFAFLGRLLDSSEARASQ